MAVDMQVTEAHYGKDPLTRSYQGRPTHVVLEPIVSFECIKCPEVVALGQSGGGEARNADKPMRSRPIV